MISRERKRRRSRRGALAVLYAADAAGADPAAVDVDPGTFVPLDDFGSDLVAGVGAHADELDTWLAETAENWTVARMPPVDRAILRMATYELRWRTDVPAGATINEAVELAKCFSTGDSSRFVNGVLGKLAKRFDRTGADSLESDGDREVAVDTEPVTAAAEPDGGDTTRRIVAEPHDDDTTGRVVFRIQAGGQ